MAPNRKKKKLAANPARGFATVSLPSKVKESPNEDDRDVSGSTALENSTSIVASQPPNLPQPVKNDKNSITEMTPEELEAHLEESELRRIVETALPRCNQDVSRQVARLETEHRQLRLPSQSYRLATANWFSGDMLDSLILKHEKSMRQSAYTQTSHPTSTNEEFLLVSLWTLKRVLAALRFPHLEKALQYVLQTSFSGTMATASDYIWGLSEAFEWYAVNSETYGFRAYDDTSSTHKRDQNSTTGTEVADDIRPAESIEEHQLPKEIHEAAAESDLEDLDLSSLPSSGSDDDEDPASFIEKYCRLQGSLYRMQQKMQQRDSKRLLARKSVLEKRLDKLERDPLFDRSAAQAMWQPRKRDLDIEAAQKAQHERKSSRNKPRPNISDNDEDDLDNSMMSGMFATNEEDSSVTTANDSQTIEIVDFGTWSGASPKKVLEDACAGFGFPTSIRFTTLSTSSFSTRKSVEMSLSSDGHLDLDIPLALPQTVHHTSTGNTIKINMVAVAAATAIQAECYLSTIMLFILSTLGLSEQKHHNRLPSAWRNIFQQLVDNQKELADQTAIAELKEIRCIINGTNAEIQSESGAASRNNKVRDDVNTAAAGHFRSNHEKLDEQQAMALWGAKSSTMTYQTMLRDREQLPVHHYKSHVLKGVKEHPVVIICADTGAGKSTQIPSFILEHELSHGHDCHIVVTQPRRISAISLARRVSRELGEGTSEIGTDRSLVGYAIRLESKTSRSTRLTYATTGVLLRMLESSPRLEQIDCLVLDEVHERTMDLDLLFIVLRKLQMVRTNLKIVLMSATVDARKFSNYFGGAPIIDIPGRTFPVEVKYLEDAIETTLSLRRKGVNAHSAEETNFVEQDDSSSDQEESMVKLNSSTQDLKEYSATTRTIIAEMDEYRIDYELVADIATAIATKPEYQKYSSAILIFMPGIAEIRRLQNVLSGREVFASGWVVHLLHSSFATDDLERAFVVPPRGQRKIVISTNIAETGITIPDVTAVIDTCKEKIMHFDERRQVSRLREGFISRSSARQRKGRAARVQEGICFHLVTRLRYDSSMLDQHVPEMLRLSLQEAILRIKVWNLGSTEDTLSSAIDPPSAKNIRRAISKLKDAGALSQTEQLTALGKQLSKLPLEVILGKLAIFGIVFRCLDPLLTIIAALSSKSPFQTGQNGQTADPRAAFARGDSDLLSTLNAFEGWQKARAAGIGHQYCRKHHLSHQSLSAIEDQKAQLLVNIADAGLLQLTNEEKNAIKTRRSKANQHHESVVPSRYNLYQHDLLICIIIAIAFYPRVLVREGRGWRNVYSNQQMNLASSSINRRAEKPPRWLCFYEATQSKSGALNVLETSRVPEVAIITVLGSEATFKFFSGTVDIDTGKLRFSFGNWKQVTALKAIRDRIQNVMDHAVQKPGSDLSSEDEEWVQTWVQLVTGQPPRTV